MGLKWACGCAIAFGGSYNKLFSVSGVSSTEMDLIDRESSLDRLVEEAACDPQPLETMDEVPVFGCISARDS